MDLRVLAQISEDLRIRVLEELRAGRVSIPCADGVIVAPGVGVGAGTLLLPGTILLGACVIGENCVIGPRTVLSGVTVGAGCELNSVQGEDASMGDGCVIGPFVRLRPGTKLGSALRIGNFVEIKNATVGDRTSISHLSYIGDAEFGSGVNVGCGLAVANYDGKKKHRTRVGDGAFLGCHNVLVAPVTVGAGAFTGAGSVITEDVPPEALAIARARQVNKRESDIAFFEKGEPNSPSSSQGGETT